MPAMQVVVTGATGFIGSEIVRYLLERNDIGRVFVLIRHGKAETAAEKFSRTITAHWQKFKSSPTKNLSRLEVVSYHLSHQQSCPEVSEAEYFFHCAANTDFSLPLASARAANLYTTLNALQLAKSMKNLKCFVHLSTAFVDMQAKKRFNNFYEQSKKEAEDAVRMANLPHLIFRPSIVVGDSQDGYMLGCKALYALLRMCLQSRLLRVPIFKEARLDVVPVDFVARSILAVSLDLRLSNQTLLLCAGESAPSLRELFRQFAQVFALPQAKFVNPKIISLLRQPFVFPFIGRDLQNLLHSAQGHLPYLVTRKLSFAAEDSENFLRQVPIRCPSFEAYGAQLFNFCRKTHWGKIPLNI